MVRVYLPPDTNCLLSVFDHCLRSHDYVNVVVAGKQPQLDYLLMDEAILHCTRGIGIWDWAGTETPGVEPDVVLACAGEIRPSKLSLPQLFSANVCRSFWSGS